MPAGRKSRTGCALCKKKRLKCDETRPACERCTRSRVACPGYQRSLRWSTKHEVPKSCPLNEDSAMDERFTPPQDLLSRRSLAPRTSTIDLTEACMRTTSSAWSVSQTGAQSDRLISSLSQSPDLVSWLDLSLVGGDIDQEAFENVRAQDFPSSSSWNHGIGAIDELYWETEHTTILSGDEQQHDLTSAEVDMSVFSASISQQLESCGSIQPVMINTEYALMEYYFKEVAVIYSCFDGKMNPFRSTMARLWTSSANLAKTLQSMSAACLAPTYPYLAAEGLKLRNEVFASISIGMTSGDSVCTALLVAIMLGQTAGWHEPRDLGLAFYRRSKELLQQLELDSAVLDRSVISTDISFFQNAIGYWETLFAFVLPDEKSHPLTKLSKGLYPAPPLIGLHPWTLANAELMSILRRVGQLVLTNRTMLHEKKFWCRSDLLSFTNAICESAELEQRLLDLDLPTASALVDPEDDATPVSHITMISRAYQLVTLILIYRIFPDVLDTRMASHPNFEIFGCDAALHSVTDLDSGTDCNSKAWLRQLAMYAVQLIKDIPLQSHTRCIQPFLLIALSCEVGSLSTDSSVESRIATVRAREFIQARLQDFKFYLPPKPAQCRLDLVLEIWRKLDSGKADAFWLDVVIENKWQFLFG